MVHETWTFEKKWPIVISRWYDMIDWIGFYAISAIFQPLNNGGALNKRQWSVEKF